MNNIKKPNGPDYVLFFSAMIGSLLIIIFGKNQTTLTCISLVLWLLLIYLLKKKSKPKR